jgi:Spy/CpxP family protein refolding chaperone
MSRTFALIFAVILVACVSVAPASAVPLQPPPPGGPGGPGGPGHGGPGFGPRGLPPELLDDIEATESQRTQIAAIFESSRGETKPLMEAVRDAHETFRAAVEAATPDPTTVGTAAIALREAETKMRAAHEAVMEKVKAVLTPAQRTRLETLRAQHGPRGHRPGSEGPREH